MIYSQEYVCNRYVFPRDLYRVNSSTSRNDRNTVRIEHHQNSNSQILVLRVRSGGEFGGRPAPNDVTPLDDIVTIGYSEQCVEILVNEQDRLARFTQQIKTAPDLITDQRRKSFCCLVEDE